MKEEKIRFYGILFMMLFVLIFIFGFWIHNVTSALKVCIVSFIFAAIYWETPRWLVLKACKQIPGLIHTKKRIQLILKFLIPCVFLLPIFEMEVLQIIGIVNFTIHDYWNYLFFFGLNLICLTVVIVLYESIYYIKNWKIAFAETERVKKMNLNVQYQFLKEQIKPHFLFNSLNTLASLIQSNPIKAEEFVEEMSSVYRYLLSKKEKQLSPLPEEINFLKSYIAMLKTRFAESLQVDMDLDDSIPNLLIPPFVLQLLVENAVKHNTISIEQPLYVTIKISNDNHLIVANNIQKKNIAEHSEKTGLMNLIARYKLLNKEDELLILNDEKTFQVTLPLIHELN